MPETGLQLLTQPPAAVLAASAVIEGFDQCLAAGFGRLGPPQEAALASLGRAFAATPLRDPLSAALAAVRGNEFQPRAFAVLAAARCALEAARYDSLRQNAASALGRPVDAAADDAGTHSPTPAAPAGAGPAPDAGPTASVRHWLMELAIAGFAQLDPPAVAPFAATLEHLLADPARGRLAALLAGFHRVLLVAVPVGSAADVPARRWADLWSRAMVTSLAADAGQSGGGSAGGSAGAASAAEGTKVDGRLTPLAADVRQHGHFVSAAVYGVLDAAGESGPPRIVRVTLNGYKVDALDGADAWKPLNTAAAAPLLQALGEHRAVDVKQATLLPTGDLLWDGQAKLATGSADVAAVAARHLAPGVATSTPIAAPADRHPVQLAEPVWLEGVKVAAGDDPWRSPDADGRKPWTVTTADGATLPLAMHRLPGGRGLSPDDVAAAGALLVLLRFDENRWLAQPVAARAGGKSPKLAWVGANAWEAVTAKPKKGQPDTLKVLKERAGRLLRQKA